MTSSYLDSTFLLLTSTIANPLHACLLLALPFVAFSAITVTLLEVKMTSSYLVLDSTFLLTSTIANPLHACLLLALPFVAFAFFHPGGLAWALSGNHGSAIPGPPGVVLALSGQNPHHALARLAESRGAKRLMAFSVGLTRFIVASHPDTAREILAGAAFSDRPVKEAAAELMFHRAMGFAPNGEYWLRLRRLASAHAFSPRRLAGRLADRRRAIGEETVRRVGLAMARDGVVGVRPLLHLAGLDNVMVTVFGVSFDELDEGLGSELEEMVKEGYELLGSFNWGDHVPLLRLLDVHGVRRRCRTLASRVRVFVARIIEEHRRRREMKNDDDDYDFVDVLLGLEGEERLEEEDMIAVLWEMIFRGTDTVAILLEWVLARMALHPDVQSKAQAEIDAAAAGGGEGEGTAGLRYLQCVVKECLRMHPPGPLLSWARVATQDALVDGGRFLVPAGTTAVVNMWAIARDESLWRDAGAFRPERFLEEAEEILSVAGCDLRLAPFGAGRRVCPGRALALATVHLWLAQLLRSFRWVPSGAGVDMSERLNMSLEMKTPLLCLALPRTTA